MGGGGGRVLIPSRGILIPLPQAVRGRPPGLCLFGVTYIFRGTDVPAKILNWHCLHAMIEMAIELSDDCHIHA